MTPISRFFTRHEKADALMNAYSADEQTVKQILPVITKIENSQGIVSIPNQAIWHKDSGLFFEASGISEISEEQFSGKIFPLSLDTLNKKTMTQLYEKSGIAPGSSISFSRQYIFTRTECMFLIDKKDLTPATQ